MTETYLEQLKPERFPSPCFVVDEAKLRSNVAILDECSGARARRS